MMKHIWRPIPGYEGYYEVSNRGLVRSLDRTIAGHRKDGGTFQSFVKGRTLSPAVWSDGYGRVMLHRDGKRRPWLVHRAVLMAFVGAPPAEGMQCCHRDGDPSNNNVSNLYWGTRSQNVQDMLRHGTGFQQKKTHCAKGHPYDEENTQYCTVKGGVHRRCRACERSSWQRQNERRRKERVA